MKDGLRPLIAAVDLDDTLLRNDGTISRRTLAALGDWLQSGRQVVIATGRPRRSVSAVLPVEMQALPLICYNGAAIYLDGCCIYENLIPPEAAHLIVAQMQLAAPEAIIGLEIDGELYLNRPMQRATPYHVTDLQTLEGRAAAKVLLFGGAGDALTPVLQNLPASARALHSARYQFVQVLAATADKAEALRVLMGEWDAPLAQVAAFGDDTNDTEMVRVCGLGVAVANAVAEVKAVADEITASNDEDGVALVLERLITSAA
jgi:Cof subfamily protein (haloacid dehalogenase superfamily)